MRIRFFFIISLFTLFSLTIASASAKIEFIKHNDKSQIEVKINGTYFTSFLYSDDLERPCLYPIKTLSGIEITRGYPLNPRPFERIDHPHHYGLWFNHGDVNGLDFWNNSFAVKPELKHKYGTIRYVKLIKISNKRGRLVTLSKWLDNEKNELLTEKTTYIFSGEEDGTRAVERITELKAVQRVTLNESKEGMFGLRIDKAFEAPFDKPVKRIGEDGKLAENPFINNDGVNGLYRNAEGKKGESEVWGKRTPWVAVAAEKDNELITIVMLDHKKNPYFPAWPHAREYGLFALNNLGGKAMDKTTETPRIELKPGEKVVFKHKLIVSGNLSDDQINSYKNEFWKR
ncbi:MAG: hypothetical protein GX102_14275 [Porphyromonadaceae bacterium]|nr:hypothetical protein [Porphyromonadaceae bacterium]